MAAFVTIEKVHGNHISRQLISKLSNRQKLYRYRFFFQKKFITLTQYGDPLHSSEGYGSSPILK